LFAGVGIVILLSVITKSWRNLALVLVNLAATSSSRRP
jgi:hypothetical protein